MTRAVVAEWAPRRVILFGSRARGDHRPDSDYDLMIVIDAPGSVDDCETAIRTRVSSAGHPVDVSVATTEAFERRRTDVGTLEYAADREGLVLYGSGGTGGPRAVRQRRVGGAASGARAGRGSGILRRVAQARRERLSRDADAARPGRGVHHGCDGLSRTPMCRE